MKTRRTLVDNIQDQIIDMVIKQQNDDGKVVTDHIFKEGELAEKFDVSRTTIREAVRSLEVRGFVERVHGIGIRLIDKSLQVITRSLSDMLMRNGVDYTELLEVRFIVETQASKLAAIKVTNELEKMEEKIKIMEDPDNNYNNYIEADFNFHNLVFQATKNKILVAIFKSYEFIFKDLILASTDINYRPEITEGHHRKVMNYIKKRDPEGAEKAMIEHLRATEHNLKQLYQPTNQ